MEFKNNICVKNKWGGYVNGLNDDSITGIWIILDKIPVINIWQVPNTIAELKIFWSRMEYLGKKILCNF